MKSYTHSIIVSLMLFQACTTTKPSGDEKDFKPLEYIGQIEQLNDTTFFSSSVYDLTLFGDTIVVADMKHNTLFFFSKTGNLLTQLGRPGEGPGEFLGLDQFARINDSCYVMKDRVGKKLVFYNNATFDHDIKNLGMTYNTRICHIGNVLYFYEMNPEGLISQLNLTTDSITKFGNSVDFKFKDITALRNQRHLATDEMHLYTARVDRPIIEKYDLNGQLIQTLDMSAMPIFANLIESDKIPSAGSWPNVIFDMYLDNSNLYLLAGYRINDDNHGCNKLIIVSTSGPTMQVKSLHSLSKGWYYSTLGVAGDELYAFEWTQGILHKYKL